MNRKILHDYRKSNKLNGSSKGRIGTILGVQDKNGEYLVVGDKIFISCYSLEGIILYNYNFGEYRIFFDYHPQEGDIYNIKAYNNSIKLRLDNGMKKYIEKVR